MMTELEKTTQKEEPDLYKRSIKGGAWVFALKWTTQGMGLVKTIVVANCLLLENLGLISIALILMEILNAFSESGINAALVQKKDDISDYLDTAWVISIIRGIILFAVLYFTAPLFASIKVSEENVSLAISVMRVVGVCMLINGFRNIGVVYFQKSMEFHKTFWMGTATGLADTLISIILVLIYRNVWSVVAARLISVCIGFVMSYLICPYRPKFHFVPEKAKELWKFGRWIFGGRILGFILQRGDDIFVWMCLGTSQLALYERAFRFSKMPVTHISQVINQVSFPAYSKIQDDLPRLREAYLKVLKITLFFSFPATFLIFILGPDFVHLFLPERMWPMTIALQILALKGLIGSLGFTRGPVFKSLGKPYVTLHLQIIKLVLLAILIYPMTKTWGIAGTAMATLTLNVFVGPFGLIIANRLMGLKFSEVIRTLLAPLLASISSLLFIVLIKTLLLPDRTYLSFSLLFVFSLIFYVINLRMIDLFSKDGYSEILWEQAKFLLKKWN